LYACSEYHHPWAELTYGIYDVLYGYMSKEAKYILMLKAEGSLNPLFEGL
jgi:hypothetical protein